jgi:asparagine synthetase B (glutamine-hydrolysing)
MIRSLLVKKTPCNWRILQRKCGTIAFYIFADRRVDNSNERLLKGAMKTLHHRGPESSDYWISESKRVGLGHVRLSLVDLSTAGNQPMFNQRKTLGLVANGEVCLAYDIYIYIIYQCDCIY